MDGRMEDTGTDDDFLSGGDSDAPQMYGVAGMKSSLPGSQPGFANVRPPVQSGKYRFDSSCLGSGSRGIY